MRIYRNRYGEVRSGYKITAVLLISLLIEIVVARCMFYFIDRSLLLKAMDNGLDTILTLISEVIFIVVPILFWIKVEKKSINKIGLINIKEGVKELIVGLALGAIAISIVAIVLISFNEVEIKYTPNGINGIKTLILSFITYILVGFAEEILCRGYIMSVLKSTRNKYAVIIISSLIFSAMHLGNYGISVLAFLNLTLVGALFAYMFMKSKNIWMCIGYHITWNYFQGAVWGFSVSGSGEKGICSLNNLGNSLINGGEFGPEGGIIVTLIICLAFLFVYKYYKHRNINEFMDMN